MCAFGGYCFGVGLDGVVPDLSELPEEELPDEVPDLSELPDEELPDEVPDDPDFDELSPLLTEGAAGSFAPADGVVVDGVVVDGVEVDGASPAFVPDLLSLVPGVDVVTSLFIWSVFPPLEHPARIPAVNNAAAVKPIHFFMFTTPLYPIGMSYVFQCT